MSKLDAMVQSNIDSNEAYNLAKRVGESATNYQLYKKSEDKKAIPDYWAQIEHYISRLELTVTDNEGKDKLQLMREVMH
jgi:hypothetical protein